MVKSDYEASKFISWPARFAFARDIKIICKEVLNLGSLHSHLVHWGWVYGIFKSFIIPV